jgi:hypothetical protein
MPLFGQLNMALVTPMHMQNLVVRIVMCALLSDAVARGLMIAKKNTRVASKRVN